MEDNYVDFCSYGNPDNFHVLYNFDDNKIYFSDGGKYTLKNFECKINYLSYILILIGMPILRGLEKVFDNTYQNNIFINILFIMLIIFFCLMFSRKMNSRFLKLYGVRRIYIGLTNEELEEYVIYGRNQFKKQLLLIICILIILVIFVLVFIFYGSGFLLILSTMLMLAFGLTLFACDIVKKFKFFKMYEKGEIKI